MKDIIVLLDNASCAVLLLVVLWRFDLTVRYLASLQKSMMDDFARIIQGVSNE